MDVNKFESLVKFKVVPPIGLHIPLLPSHIYKLKFVLSRKCAETENQSICNHSLDLSQALGYVLNSKRSADWICWVEGVRGVAI